MRSFVLVVLLVAAAAAIPMNGTQFLAKRAYDTTSRGLRSDHQCMKSRGYEWAMLRAYGPDFDGSKDNDGFDNIEYALKAGLKVHPMVTPSLSGRKNGAQQFREVQKHFTDGRFNVPFIWLQVSTPFRWGSQSVIYNANFIRDFITEAARNQVNVGVYTNWYDWAQITGNSRSLSPKALWYWHVGGPGDQGHTAADLHDYVDFAGLPAPVSKQYAVATRECNMNVNLDVTEVNLHLADPSVLQSMSKMD